MDWSYSSITPLYSCSDLWTGLWHQGQHQLTRKRSGPSYTCPRSSYQHHSLPWIPRSNLVMNNMKYMAGCPKFGILNLNLEPPEIIWFLSPSIKVSWSKEQTKAEVRWASQTFQSSTQHANMNICFVLVFFFWKSCMTRKIIFSPIQFYAINKVIAVCERYVEKFLTKPTDIWQNLKILRLFTSVFITDYFT